MTRNSTTLSSKKINHPQVLFKKIKLRAHTFRLLANVSPVDHKLKKTFQNNAFHGKKPLITRLLVYCNVGFGNALYLRGTGAGLSWDKGITLKNINANEWLWETRLPFERCEFKLLINDTHYELGDNHQLQQGQSLQCSPSFK